MIKNVNIDKIFEYMWDVLTIYHYEKKELFYNLPCNSIFELHQTFVTHCIYTL
jgi:hypothetical protein